MEMHFSLRTSELGGRKRDSQFLKPIKKVKKLWNKQRTTWRRAHKRTSHECKSFLNHRQLAIAVRLTQMTLTSLCLQWKKKRRSICPHSSRSLVHSMAMMCQIQFLRWFCCCRLEDSGKTIKIKKKLGSSRSRQLRPRGGSRDDAAAMMMQHMQEGFYQILKDISVKSSMGRKFSRWNSIILTQRAAFLFFIMSEQHQTINSITAQYNSLIITLFSACVDDVVALLLENFSRIILKIWRL